MALKVGELYGELSLDRSGFSHGLSKAHEDFSSFGSNLLGKAAGLAAGLGLAMGAGDIIKKIGEIGISFQDMGNTFRAVSGASSTQMDQMSKKAIELGNDLSLPTTSATDAAAAMVELAKGGLGVQDSMDAAKGVLQLATAATIDTGTAATYTADALNTFHLHGQDAITVADLLAGAANASSGDISDMALSLQQAGSVFAAAHVPIQDVVTLIAEMAQNGIRGSDAGTSLKTMMLALQTPTHQQATLMKELNLHLYDSHGAMRDFRDIIADAQGPLSKLTQAQRDNALGVVFGSDAVRAGNIILGGGTKAYDEMRAAVTKQGSAANVAAAQSQGLGGALRGLQSQAETLGLQIFQQVSPALEGMARSLSDALPKAVDFTSKALDDLGKHLADAQKLAKPLADEYVANMQRAAKDTGPQFAQLRKDFGDLGATMQSFVKSEAFAGIVAAYSVLLPAALKPTIAGLQVMIDQFRISTTLLFGMVRVTWDVFHGDWKAAWKDANDTVRTESENMQHQAKDSAEFWKATTAAMSSDVFTEYEGMKARVLDSTNGMHQQQLEQATAQKASMRNAAKEIGVDYGTYMADGIVSGIPAVAGAGARVMASAEDASRTQAASAGEIGAFMAQGIALGLSNNAGFISSAAVAATRNAMHEAQANAKVSSPSRLWAEELGLPLAQGIAVGLTQGHGLVASAARGLMKPVSASFGSRGSTLAMADAGGAPSPAMAGRSDRTVNVTQNFYGSTADHRQMLADAAWEARRLR